jgi:hypothetical protein
MSGDVTDQPDDFAAQELFEAIAGYLWRTRAFHSAMARGEAFWDLIDAVRPLVRSKADLGRLGALPIRKRHGGSGPREVLLIGPPTVVADGVRG